MNFKLIAYSMDFSSFLIQKLKNKENLKNIILFGSVSRGEEGKSSDIDIFIELNKEDSKIEKEINSLLKEFLKSTKTKNYWNLLGVNNEIKISFGKLENWKELKSSLVSNGILLFGKFKTDIKGNHKTYFIWGNIKPNSKRVLFNKQMFGYNQNRKFYNGLIQKYRGERIGKGCIDVPLENGRIFHDLFKKFKISVKIKKVVEY